MFPGEAAGAGPSPDPASGAVRPDPADAGLDAPESIPVRPLGFRELLDLPFALIQPQIAALAATTGLVLAVAEGIVLAVTAAGSAATGGSDAGTAWSAILATVVCGGALRFVVRAVTVPIGLARVRQRPIGIRPALALISGRFGALLNLQVRYTVVGLGVLALGTPLLITLPPALVWLGWLRARQFTAVPVLFEEGGPAAVAVRRAKTLSAGAQWRLARLSWTLRLVSLLLMPPLIGLMYFVSSISGTHRWPIIALAVATVLILLALVEMVESAARVLAYVDRRCRREAWDVRLPGAALEGVR
ncbi:hypothetical protein [Nocardia sp. alder85J]|uniref:hypothetical protein n=1 Tax=Nocardia sp. alder85J TaxID=2862949 RepID=UPI001CD7AD92|nr:hypothetical protein [Nocardia sp. alder85J]MCX4096569.1 hypothetical protein [Nocardia sp. alder85J]